MQVAAELFPIRYVCAFGDKLPDGVVPLDDVSDVDAGRIFQPSARPGDAAAHVAVVTFDVTADGIVPVARSHRELIAGGLAALLEGGLARDATILSAIPIGSFAGLALTLVPWLLCRRHAGAASRLRSGRLRRADAAHTTPLPSSCRARRWRRLPTPACSTAPIKTILALWRAPERLAAAAPWHGEAALVDIASFGEIGLLPARRGRDGRPAPMPLGIVAVPHGAAEQSRWRRLCAADRHTGAARPDGADAGFPAWRRSGDETASRRTVSSTPATPAGSRATPARFALTAPPAGIAAVGFYRFRQRELDALVATADPTPSSSPCPTPYWPAPRRPRPRRRGDHRGIEANGVNPLIAGAFRRAACRLIFAISLTRH